MQGQLVELLQIICNLDAFGLTKNAAIDLLGGIATVIAYLPHEQVSNVILLI
jgi:hypothetical protein